MDQPSTRPDLKILPPPQCIGCARTHELWGGSVVLSIEGCEVERYHFMVCPQCADSATLSEAVALKLRERSAG